MSAFFYYCCCCCCCEATTLNGQLVRSLSFLHLPRTRQPRLVLPVLSPLKTAFSCSLTPFTCYCCCCCRCCCCHCRFCCCCFCCCCCCCCCSDGAAEQTSWVLNFCICCRLSAPRYSLLFYIIIEVYYYTLRFIVYAVVHAYPLLVPPFLGISSAVVLCRCYSVPCSNTLS